MIIKNIHNAFTIVEDDNNKIIDFRDLGESCKSGSRAQASQIDDFIKGYDKKIWV